MKLIVGLGNPGSSYKNSRHNIGFMAVDSLAVEYKVKLKRKFTWRSLHNKTRIGTEEVILAEPLTFMNLSGSAVKQLISRHNLELSDLLVIADDLDLELGRIKIKPSGSSAGHRGLSSVIAVLKSDNFSRLRIGIGSPPEHIEASDYVLSDFSRKEKALVDQIIDEVKDCVRVWLERGTEKTMDMFNQKPACRQAGS